MGNSVSPNKQNVPSKYIDAVLGKQWKNIGSYFHYNINYYPKKITSEPKIFINNI